MTFLLKHIARFFDWWAALTELPTIDYGQFSVNWSIIVFVMCVWILMLAPLLA